MAEWQTLPLGEALTFQRGFDITKAEQRDGPYPVISSSGPKTTHAKFKVRGPGVVIGRKGSLGTVFYSDGDYWPHDTTLWVRDFHNNDPRFAYYFLQTMGFERLDAGAANPSLNRNHIHLIPVQWPPLPTQRRIASILSAYDELIKNNTQRINILEEMAHGLYREWFVNFRFPGYRHRKSLDQWKPLRLGECISVDKGVSYNGAGLTQEGNPMVNLKNILPGGGFRRDATKPYSGDFKDRHTVKPGDVILANTDLTQAGNIVGSPAIVPKIREGKPILISHHLYAVRLLDTGMSSYFIYNLMLTDDFRAFAKGYAIGTTVLGLSRDGVLEYEFRKPPDGLIDAFNQKAAPIYHLVENLNQRNENLRRTRDVLLPKLISGEIEV